MSLQVIVTYLQGFLLIPLFGVDAAPEYRDNIAPQNRVAQRQEARHLYETAEQFRRTGLLEMAYECFREAAERYPGTELGRRALEQVNELATMVHRPATRTTASVASRETGVVTAHYSRRVPQGVEGELVNLRQLRTLYHEARNLVKQRQLRKAHDLFQQVHMLAPASRYGQDAVDQMHDIERQLETPKRHSIKDRVQQILETTEPIEIHLEKPVREATAVIPAKFERQRDAVRGEGTARDYKVTASFPSVWTGVRFDVDISKDSATRGEGLIRVGLFGCRIGYDAEREQRWRVEVFAGVSKQ